MKRIFLFLIILLACLSSVSALKIGETAIVDEFAITFNGVSADGSLDMVVTEYVDAAVDSLTEGQTTQTNADDGECLFTTFKEFNIDNTPKLVVTACESGEASEGDVIIIYAEDQSCFLVTVDELGQTTQLNVDVCPTQSQQESDPIIITADDGSCFSVLIKDMDPLQIEVSESDDCEDVEEPVYSPTFIFEDNICFKVEVETIDPVTLNVDKVALDECIETISHEIVGDTCFEITTLSLDPVQLQVKDVAMTECSDVVNPNDNPTPQPGGPSDNNNNNNNNGGPSGSMSGAPLIIPDSNALFNDVVCNQQLNKEPCVDGYRRYSCESYNSVDDFKEYKKECASCNNQKKDHNELGVDCGNVCPACLASGNTLIQQDLGDDILAATPGAFWKWLIPLLVLILIAGLLVGLILVWHYKQKNPMIVPVEETPDVLKGLSLEKISMIKHFIKVELNKGLARPVITGKLTHAGWKISVVDHIFDEMQHHVMPVQYEEQLRKYVVFYLKKGIHKDKIKENLINAGWKAEAIEKVLKKNF
jgi:hypothetical protein